MASKKNVKGAKGASKPKKTKPAKETKERIMVKDLSFAQDEGVEVAVRERSSAYDSMVAAILEMETGQKLSVDLPEDMEIEDFHFRVSGVLRRRVKNHTDAEGYKFAVRRRADGAGVVILCKEIEE